MADVSRRLSRVNVGVHSYLVYKELDVNAQKFVKGNVAVYKDLNKEFVTKNSFCHAFNGCK